MLTVDFCRSFISFRIDTLKKTPLTVSHKPPFTLNTARIQIDGRCEVRDKRSGDVQEFVLGASCKTERVGVERDIWLEPNADFIPIFSTQQFLNLKTFDRANKGVLLYPATLGVQPERQVGVVADCFDRVDIKLRRREGVILERKEEIVEATLANRLLVARTTLETDRYKAVIEYPIKTMNANERDLIYQLDTGPVLYPDLSRGSGELIEGFDLAFIAWNCPEWAEFIVRDQIEVAPGVSVYHYCRTARHVTRNQVIAEPVGNGG